MKRFFIPVFFALVLFLGCNSIDDDSSVVTGNINKDGSIADVKVVRSAGDSSLDKEAIRLVKLMPKWKPGKQRDKVVRVKYAVPINFKLQ